jgi:succinate dehydrogenase/fumarate reductase flavoprotein subunit
MAIAPAEMRWHEEVDIGIVGAGGCGLAAAHAAAHPELKVVVWEKATIAGGTTALSAGLIAAAGSRMQRAAGLFEVGDDLLNDVRTRNGGHSDAALTSQLCAGAAGLVEWLSDGLNLRLELVSQRGDSGHTRARLHAPPSRNGKELVDGLVRLLERRGIRLRLSTPVLHLWTDAGGAVIGVRVKVPRKSPANVRCHKLILATDGFGANRDLVAQHCSGAAALLYVGAVTNNGEALAWAAEIGAATRDLDAYEPYATVAVGANLLMPWALVDNGAILVNQGGERFADETRGPAALAAAVLAQPGRVAYEVLDARILQLVAAHNPHFATEVVPRVLRRADEVGGLAKQFQVASEVLARTVGGYNAAVVSGGDTFGRSAFGAPLAPPYYGVRIGAALLQTLGGLAIDAHARVVRPDGTPIPNLYAGGGAAVGISGPGSDGYLLGTGLLCALGWGKIAGEHAAQELLAARTATATPSAGEEPVQ